MSRAYISFYTVAPFGSEPLISAHGHSQEEMTAALSALGKRDVAWVIPHHIILSTELSSILTARETCTISFLACSMSLIKYISMTWSASSEGFIYHTPCSLIIYVGCDETDSDSRAI